MTKIVNLIVLGKRHQVRRFTITLHQVLWRRKRAHLVSRPPFWKLLCLPSRCLDNKGPVSGYGPGNCRANLILHMKKKTYPHPCSSSTYKRNWEKTKINKYEPSVPAESLCCDASPTIPDKSQVHPSPKTHRRLKLRFSFAADPSSVNSLIRTGCHMGPEILWNNDWSLARINLNLTKAVAITLLGIGRTRVHCSLQNSVEFGQVRTLWSFRFFMMYLGCFPAASSPPHSAHISSR